MALVILENGVTTKSQRQNFYEFILNVYTSTIKDSVKKYGLTKEVVKNLKKYGYCYMAHEYFGLYIGQNPRMFKFLFPELHKYKPAHIDDGFWFENKVRRQTKRINIIKKVLEDIK